jgi:DNA-binding response OmpR family regulator
MAQGSIHPRRSDQPVTGPREPEQSPQERLASAPATAGLSVGILDRDRGFVTVLAKRLQRLGWTSEILAGKPSAAAVAAMDLDALIVDPAIFGARQWAWLERLCRPRPAFAIVLCATSSTAAERIRALRLGVDDAVTKPCHPEEMIARIETISAHRRPATEGSPAPIAVDEVEIRLDQHQAFVAGASLSLTRREYQLMQLLCRSGGDVLRREHIYEALWGYEMIRNDRSVDVFVHKLRRKLERASPRWRYIHTHFGVGYQLIAERMAAEAPVRELRPAALQEELEAA